VLPAARKKGALYGLPAESNFESWSAGCIRSKQSDEGLCCDWNGATAMARARRSWAVAMGKAEEEEKKKTTTAQA